VKSEAAQGLYSDVEAARDWSAQMEGDGDTLDVKIATEGGESKGMNEPAIRPADVRHNEEGAVW